jgi:TRAP-type C4-dicarboxylate transport system substrate-binding protein
VFRSEGSTRTTRRVVAVALVAVALAACQRVEVADKAGSGTLRLTLATIDNIDTNGQSPGIRLFMRSVAEVSGGRMTLVLQPSFEDGQVGAESDLVRATAGGTVDVAVASSRAFARAGIHGLEELEAPFALTSRAAEDEIASGPVGHDLLATLDGSDVIPLSLIPGPMRRPWSKTPPLTSVAAWSGVTFRTYNSPVQEATVRSLGGVSVPSSYHFPNLVRTGRLEGAETDVAQYAINGYGTLLPHAVRNEVLWPKMQVLIIGKKAWDRLTAQQQAWVREATSRMLAGVLAYHYDETTPAVALCRAGVRFSDATPQDLAAMRLATRSVTDGLAADPVTGPLLREVEAVAARHPTVDTVDLPASCLTPGRGPG